NLIYFSGGSTSANSATNTVYYFNGNDPTVQSNWTVGCADLAACGVENQTPGAPNNAANSAYIAQFNNNCLPITPILSSASVDNNASCICNGQATASGSGSIPGYTFEWFDSSFVPIGQTSATATDLCSGTYNVIVTSSIGCADTSQVTITGTNNVSISVNSESICSGETATLTGNPSSTGGTYEWNPTGESTQAISVNPTTTASYWVVYTLGSCIDSTEAIVTVSPAPIINAGNDVTVCDGESVILTATGGASYIWDNGISNGVEFIPSSGTTNYTVTGTDANGCTATDVVSVTTLANPTSNASFTPTSGTAPLNVDFTNLSSGGTSYFWDFGNGQSETTLTPSAVSTSYEAGIYTITLITLNGSCQSTWIGYIEVLLGDPAVIEVPNVFTPNNDIINDVFLITSQNLERLEGSIFNRWGHEIFTFDTIDFEWDGTTNGTEVTDGTYFIKYKAIGLDQNEYEGHTFFQLIR
ncbi:MAG: gliding motility-associated C-terminal domain-containing protein, partial [Crocinitomicaceae bacterium]